jgi:DNA-binding MarR family transcriptional regulator
MLLEGVQQTSIESYLSLHPKELGARQMAVLLCLKTHGAVCNREISSVLGKPINTITPRIKELRDMGLVERADLGYDSETRRHVILWRVVSL